MNSRTQHQSWILGIRGRAAGAALALAIMLVLAVLAPRSAQAQAYSYKVLYSFTGPPDGVAPGGGGAGVTLDAKGNLYGTTTGGGPYSSGTIFKLDTKGKETVLYSFAGGSDGMDPNAGLVRDAQGNLYGTALEGGAGGGTVFKLDTAGNLTVLHTFGSQYPDGFSPCAGLVADKAGNLYGTTIIGGTHEWGTVFKLDTAGTFSVLYSFANSPDGANPYAGVVLDAQGNLYGTTSSGGAFNYGTVFKLNPATGQETVLYSFCVQGVPCTDGEVPYAAPVLDPQGNLYGTAAAGGTIGWGTVFELDTAGTFSTLYNFAGPPDGAYPYAGLILDAQGNLYGTTVTGGNTGCTPFASGCGTVFKVNTTGAETVLYRFTQTGGDGAYSWAGLAQDAKGDLYGTTSEGGDLACIAPYGSLGCGTVFKLTPAKATKTTTTLTSAPNPSTYGEAVTFTAVVAPAPPDGETVSFMKGKTVLGTGTLSGGTAIFVTSTLKVGTTSVTAVYGGDSNFKGSKSKPVKQVVEK